LRQNWEDCDFDGLKRNSRKKHGFLPHKNDWKVSRVFRQIFPSSNEGIVVFNPSQKMCHLGGTKKRLLAEASYFFCAHKKSPLGGAMATCFSNLLDLGTPFQPIITPQRVAKKPAEYLTI
jgi:hypothetical protein